MKYMAYHWVAIHGGAQHLESRHLHLRIGLIEPRMRGQIYLNVAMGVMLSCLSHTASSGFSIAGQVSDGRLSWWHSVLH